MTSNGKSNEIINEIAKSPSTKNERFLAQLNTR